MNKSSFIAAFITKEKILSPHSGEIILNTYNIGELILTSGNLVACDPFTGLHTEPFSATLPPGRYPVILSVAQILSSGDYRVAYAMLRLNEQIPVRWEMATRPGEELTELKEEEIFGYSVDAGTGCFIDADAAETMSTFYEIFADQLEAALEKNYTHTWDWAILPFDNYTEANIVAFKSGWGDGFYASYFGYDANNNIVNVVTDFYP
ncbi:DUF4241 domain-containing protein (plasmid) [Nostoc sp. UHCC 0926]|uniref:DUF4241 domain-containing protein n=1 Tax=Nostoc sp. UHCC 0926 TaxID=3025190 RepID=UPI0023625A70|nr:DUF4241 domain-containing protein [Nostoc sp. UHCC 0926]WDD35969.1 DUF4241 domain-containing protein [Nostoc sp. UHCC 0926]